VIAFRVPSGRANDADGLTLEILDGDIADAAVMGPLDGPPDCPVSG
jgi:hypothetical protein